MRTASRIALVLTGTAIMVAASAISGAHTDRNPVKGDRVSALTAPQRARPQPRPDRIEYVQASDVMSIATAIAHPSAAPQVANAELGDSIASELAAVIDGTRHKSVTSTIDCGGNTFAAQQRNASDGGRGPAADGSAVTSYQEKSAPKSRTRQSIIRDADLSQMQTPEPAPFVIKFEAVISIDLAEFGG